MRATAKYLRTSPQKAELVLALIRGRAVDDARSILRASTKHVARDVEKLLLSAVANATNRDETASVDADRLFVSAARTGPAPTEKRTRFRAQGRAFRIHKRRCHIFLELGQRGA